MMRQHSHFRVLARWVWNFFAVMGVLAVLGLLGGLVYAQTLWGSPPKEASKVALPPDDPLQNPNGMLQWKIEDSFVQAALPPLPPLQKADQVSAAINLAAPTERIRLYRHLTPSQTVAFNDGAPKTLIQTLDATCTVIPPKDKTQYFQPAHPSKLTLTRLTQCKLALPKTGARIADSTHLIVLFLLFKSETETLGLQLSLPHNTAEARAQAITKHLSWN